MARNEVKLGGKPYPGQLIREGHYPKFSAMIDELEMLAVDHIGEQQYLELIKQVAEEDLVEFLELFANQKSKTSLSPSESSEGKKLKRSSSPFNTYIHLATTQHVRLRNLDGFWSQKRNAVPLVP